ncbi:Uncharacterised protein [Mycobacteroides abscessus subsp. abscessus]|nr:Uncharacterised protein [Mycobacteroides abscessus subsp. abscessus]
MGRSYRRLPTVRHSHEHIEKRDFSQFVLPIGDIEQINGHRAMRV